MAMNSTRLGAAIASTLSALPTPLKANDTIVWTAIANEILNEIKNHGGITIGTLSSTGIDPQGGSVNSQNTTNGQIE